MPIMGLFHAGVGTFVKPLHQIVELMPNLWTINAWWKIFNGQFWPKNGKYFYISMCMVYCFPIFNPKLSINPKQDSSPCIYCTQFLPYSSFTLYFVIFHEEIEKLHEFNDLNWAGYLLKIDVMQYWYTVLDGLTKGMILISKEYKPPKILRCSTCTYDLHVIKFTRESVKTLKFVA